MVLLNVLCCQILHATIFLIVYNGHYYSNKTFVARNMYVFTQELFLQENAVSIQARVFSLQAINIHILGTGSNKN